jgi:hypothetical protein
MMAIYTFNFYHFATSIYDVTKVEQNPKIEPKVVLRTMHTALCHYFR